MIDLSTRRYLGDWQRDNLVEIPPRGGSLPVICYVSPTVAAQSTPWPAWAWFFHGFLVGMIVGCAW